MDKIRNTTLRFYSILLKIIINISIYLKNDHAILTGITQIHFLRSFCTINTCFVAITRVYVMVLHFMRGKYCTCSTASSICFSVSFYKISSTFSKVTRHHFLFLQYTLMTELREIVAIEDRMRFDELVYRRDVESARLRDPRDHDYRHSRVSATWKQLLQ